MTMEVREFFLTIMLSSTLGFYVEPEIEKNYWTSPAVCWQHLPIEMQESKDQHPQLLLEGQQEKADHELEKKMSSISKV